MNRDIKEAEEMVHKYGYIFSESGEGAAVYFNLIIAHAELVRFTCDRELPLGFRNRLLEVVEVLRNFLVQGALSSIDLAVIRDSFQRILSWSEPTLYSKFQEEEPEILNERLFHLHRRKHVHA
ncbi:MAG: hypothetical protein A3G87_08515 [Omnitrophica bacterium RIFCSPLOWO2_12_FULL_50_11]|nr:MAG: hypothetical protein A3G87_08515 [Omnitrophica bacterium RIFCSPLOWO2_12_FULL_50_11]